MNFVDELILEVQRTVLDKDGNVSQEFLELKRERSKKNQETKETNKEKEEYDKYREKNKQGKKQEPWINKYVKLGDERIKKNHLEKIVPDGEKLKIGRTPTELSRKVANDVVTSLIGAKENYNDTREGAQLAAYHSLRKDSGKLKGDIISQLHDSQWIIDLPTGLIFPQGTNSKILNACDFVIKKDKWYAVEAKQVNGSNSKEISDYCRMFIKSIVNKRISNFEPIVVSNIDLGKDNINYNYYNKTLKQFHEFTSGLKHFKIKNTEEALTIFSEYYKKYKQHLFPEKCFDWKRENKNFQSFLTKYLKLIQASVKTNFNY